MNAIISKFRTFGRRLLRGLPAVLILLGVCTAPLSGQQADESAPTEPLPPAAAEAPPLDFPDSRHLSAALADRESRGDTLLTLIVVSRMLDLAYFASPDPLTGETRETPYGTGYILLDGCKGQEVMAHLIRRDQLDQIKLGYNERKGSIVRPVWNEVRNGSVSDIKYFELDE